MLDNAGQQMSALRAPGFFPPGASLIICLAYPVALAAAALVITRRDA